jgi:hypothetical protein
MLTFVAALPSLIEQIEEITDSEVAFRYGYQYRMIDYLTRLAYNLVLSFVGLLLGAAILKRQKWAWFINIGLQSLIIFVQIASGFFLTANESGGYVGFDSEVGRYSSIFFSAVTLYMLSRKDVRGYFQIMIKKTE